MTTLTKVFKKLFVTKNDAFSTDRTANLPVPMATAKTTGYERYDKEVELLLKRMLKHVELNLEFIIKGDWKAFNNDYGNLYATVDINEDSTEKSYYFSPRGGLAPLINPFKLRPVFDGDYEFEPSEFLKEVIDEGVIYSSDDTFHAKIDSKGNAKWMSINKVIPSFDDDRSKDLKLHLILHASYGGAVVKLEALGLTGQKVKINDIVTKEDFGDFDKFKETELGARLQRIALLIARSIGKIGENDIVPDINDYIKTEEEIPAKCNPKQTVPRLSLDDDDDDMESHSQWAGF